MSPRSFAAAMGRFSRSTRPTQLQRRRHGRPLPRRAALRAERLESRAMLTTVATLSSDLSPYTKIPVTFRRPDGSVGFSNTAFVGQLGWSGMSGAAAAAGVPASFKSFCIDGLQFVSAGRPTTFSGFTPALAAAPLGGAPVIGGSRASLLESFWRQYGPATAAGFADKTDAAAFQVAVWEIINDATASGTRLAVDLASGQFSVAAAGRTLPAVVRAQQWLAGFDATAPARVSVALYALQSPTAQDQVVPVPVVDLDVDSDNTGVVNRTVNEEVMEEQPGRPGVLIPVGGERVPMIVELPAGQSATLEIIEGADKVAVWTAATGGQRILSAQAPTNVIAAGATFWIEALAPSPRLADVAIRLSTTGGPGIPASGDTVRATTVAVDLDVDSNNDGAIDPVNGPAGTDDPIEEAANGRILFVNSDDDNRNGTADMLDVGSVAGENDLVEIVVAAAPPVGTSVSSLIVTYDETIVRLYTRRDRSGGVVSGSSVAAGSLLYAEGCMAGTSLVTVTFTVNAVQFTDTVRLTVQPYPAKIDVDIDSDNNNGTAHPTQSEWEEILEDHDYAIGKLIMLDNPQRAVTPIVLQLPKELPAHARSVGVRIDWADDGAAGEVRLWNSPVIDEGRNLAAVSAGGHRVFPGAVYKLSDLGYDAADGRIIVYAEGIKENAGLKTLAGVEGAPKVDERIRGTLVVNGDAGVFDEVKYLVANEDSFYYALHTRQEVRNALASRGVYSFADMPKFSLQPKSPLDLRDLGVADGVNLLLGDGSGVAGFKAMVYQDYITGDRQYVLSFAGTDDPFFESIMLGGDWSNNWNQTFGWEAPQYIAAMEIANGLARKSDIPKGHLVVTGHSLGGGLASAAAVVAGAPADTFNSSWLNMRTLLSPDGSGAQYDPLYALYEIYPGSLANLYKAAHSIDAYFVDYDLLTRGQQIAFAVLDKIPVAQVGSTQTLDSPSDVEMVLNSAAIATLVAGGPAAAVLALGPGALALKAMLTCHSMNVVLYSLLVTEGFSTVDMLGYEPSDFQK